MGEIASQITSLTIVYSTVYSDADQRKHQSSVALAFVRGIHRGPVDSPHKWPVTRKMFPFDDVITGCFVSDYGNSQIWSTTDYSTMGTEMNSDHFILCLAAALKSPNIVGQLKEITHSSRDEFSDLISSELHVLLKPFKDALEAEDREFKELKKNYQWAKW